jgi:hypothetical protein
MATLDIPTNVANIVATTITSATKQAGGRVDVVAGDGNTYRCFIPALFTGNPGGWIVPYAGVGTFDPTPGNLRVTYPPIT